MSHDGLTRRQLLVRSGWALGGVTVLGGCRLAPVLPTFSDSSDEDALAWVQMRADGTVVFFCPRAEMGQGISTGLTQVVAEELQIAMADVVSLRPRTDQISPTRLTVGSQSMELFFEPTATAAATLRETLRARAAATHGVERDTVAAAAGGFEIPVVGLVRYADLIDPSEDTLIEPDPKRLDEARRALRSQQSAAERTTVGRNATPVDIERIVMGSEQYSRDIVLPGMLFGGVARAPQLGAELERCDEAAARAEPGVVAVVDGPGDAVGVVAETPMALTRGLAALDCRWRPREDAALKWIQEPLDIDRAIDDDSLDHTPANDGDLSEARRTAARHMNVRYDTPMMAHACMEPRAGVARIADGRCEVWTGSQDPWFVRGHVARALGFRKKSVIVHNQRIGGAFGGRALCQPSVEAAWLANGAGRPVKVQWSREEEMRWNYVGPQFSHRIQAGVGARGQIAYWHHRMVGSPILTSSMMVPANLHWAADIPADPGTVRGTDLPYRSESRRVDFADVRKPMPTGPWRGLGAAPNTFAVECAIDELAGLAGADPLAFRARHAIHPRLAAVIERVGELSGWRHDDTLGIAAAAYKNVTFVAVVARVGVREGRPVVEHLWCAHDCGLVVSPDQVRAQIEGNLVWGVSMVLHESFRLEGGIASTTNFDTYPIARMPDTPAIDIDLVDSANPPTGSGEAAFAPAAAAIINALDRATGRRVRVLPLHASAT